MIKRRVRQAEMGNKTNCHTFRATGITAYLLNDGTIEGAQAIAAHESPRTTKLYDRTSDEITLDEVERIRMRKSVHGCRTGNHCRLDEPIPKSVHRLSDGFPGWLRSATPESVSGQLFL
jgi:hypothetical protein